MNFTRICCYYEMCTNKLVDNILFKLFYTSAFFFAKGDHKGTFQKRFAFGSDLFSISQTVSSFKKILKEKHVN